MISREIEPVDTLVEPGAWSLGTYYIRQCRLYRLRYVQHLHNAPAFGLLKKWVIPSTLFPILNESDMREEVGVIGRCVL